jgi:hypothetical protein
MILASTLAIAFYGGNWLVNGLPRSNCAVFKPPLSFEKVAVPVCAFQFSLVMVEQRIGDTDSFNIELTATFSLAHAL